MTEPLFDTHLFRYRYEGQEWCFEIKAPSAEDARRRVAALAFAPTYDGVLIARVPYALGWFGKAAVAIRNFFAGPKP